jgi:hypothetical protein
MNEGRPVLAVLGASNVARGLAELVAAARGFAAGRPHDLLVAGGHGRSYGLPTRVLGRGLTPILGSGILEDLDRLALSARRIHLAVTDVGNDVVYGVPPREILGWVERCLDPRPPGATVSLGLPPIESLDRYSDRALRLLRLAFFPSSRQLEIPELRRRLIELDTGLRELAERCGGVVEPERHWYGWDPIHVRRAHRTAAWSRHFGYEPSAADRRLADRLARLSRPSHWTLLGFELGARQPARVFADGSRLWLR